MVGVLREMVHDLNLPLDVIVVPLAEELALRDGHAVELGVGELVGVEVGGAEFALAQFLAEEVKVSESRRFVRQYGHIA
ncbi:hypothetical protein ACFX13_011544 [Malus domestica]|uniref:Uncharacterized protein n=1 Tax=Malus domestica TaxID=3750 RepID=A0A498I7W3_MALDO|nr:hypothetical protein DVH24_040673 [Malus domestica]